MSFKMVFLFFSSGGHFVLQSGTILAILVKGHEEHFCQIILKLGHGPGRCRLKVFLCLALATILFSGAEPFRQFW